VRATGQIELSRECNAVVVSSIAIILYLRMPIRSLHTPDFSAVTVQTALAERTDKYHLYDNYIITNT
jgi:hypothetical protein